VWLALAVALLAPQALAQKQTTPPLPFAYVGTLDQGSERYAVLAKRDQSVLLVRAGETINDEYRVHSIVGERLLVVHLVSGAVETLTLPAPGAAEAASAPPSQLPDVAKEAASAAPASEPDPDGARPGYAH
jgi:hypothetical protein